jgi:hypothetical protein
LLGAGFRCLSAIDIDLVHILTDIGENSDKVRTNFKDPARNCEDRILASIRRTEHTHSQGGKQGGMVG